MNLDRTVTALVDSGLLHDDAHRIAAALARHGLRVENGDVGAHPDLIDRDGDRWWEVSPGQYAMDPFPGDEPSTGRPVALSTVEHNAGPLIAVPRLAGRAPVKETT